MSEETLEERVAALEQVILDMTKENIHLQNAFLYEDGKTSVYRLAVRALLANNPAGRDELRRALSQFEAHSVMTSPSEQMLKGVLNAQETLLKILETPLD